MTGPTHRQYSNLFVGISALYLYSTGVDLVLYYMILPVFLAIAGYACKFPDVDHDWSNVHDKTATNKIINTLIHVTGGKHRSWQTHSIDICAVYTVIAWILPNLLFSYGYINDVERIILSMEMLAFASGWISHLFADMMTSAGVRIFCWNKFKLKFVPKKVFGFRFNTGGDWEAFNYKTIKLLNIPWGLFIAVYPIAINFI